MKWLAVTNCSRTIFPAWGTLARSGKRVLPAAEDDVEFASMIVAAPEEPEAVVAIDRPKILIGHMTI